MRVYDNGIYRDATAEEVQGNAAPVQTEAAITDAERIDALEAAVLELAEVILNG